jgi:hypothetical protein
MFAAGCSSGNQEVVDSVADEDVTSAADRATGDSGVLTDAVGDTTVHKDTVGELPPLPDVVPDLPTDTLPELTTPDVTPDVAEDVAEDCFGPDANEVKEQCDPPVYSDNCLEVDYFQCGFEGSCEDGVLTVQWHEHVFCPGQEMEDIVSYSCTYDCDCAPVDYIDWASNGDELIAQACLGPCKAPSDYVEITLSDLIQNPGAYDDQKVSLVGTVAAPYADCDAEDCGPDNPCCNGCFGVYYFVESKELIQVIQGEVTVVGCPGNDCDWMDNCTPFEFFAPYRIWGIVEAGMMNTGALHVDGYCEPEAL